MVELTRASASLLPPHAKDGSAFVSDCARSEDRGAVNSIRTTYGQE